MLYRDQWTLVFIVGYLPAGLELVCAFL